jgi:hypothetical protein
MASRCAGVITPLGTTGAAGDAPEGGVGMADDPKIAGSDVGSVISPAFTRSVPRTAGAPAGDAFELYGRKAAVVMLSAFDGSALTLADPAAGVATATLGAGTELVKIGTRPVGAAGALPMCGSGAFFASLFVTSSSPLSLTTTAPFAMPFSTGREVRLFATMPTSFTVTWVCTVTAAGAVPPSGAASGLTCVLRTPSCAFGIVITSLPLTTSTFEPGM